MEKEDHCTASFSSYSTGNRISETAERVRLEFADEFEFVTLPSECDLVFPIFRRNLIAAKSSLSTEEDQSNSSSSLSDEEELEGISSESYRRWTPDKSRTVKSWRKSKSTGSSSSSSSSWKRWVMKDLLKRSYSEGKESLKFQNSNSDNRIESTKKKKEIVSGHEKYYERKKVMKKEEKRKSQLPHKQHIFGFFGKTLLLLSQKRSYSL